MPDLYALARAFIAAVLRVYFRDVFVRGLPNVPAAGPVLFVAAPHANQFVDPSMLLTSVPRRVAFCMARKSMERVLVGLLARQVGAIPVSRAQDFARSASGKITTSTDSSGKSSRTELAGVGTAFTTELECGSSVNFGKISLGVAEVVSDTLVRLKKDLSDDEIAALQPGVAFRATPPISHQELFDSVWARLGAGGCVGIFPEGGSHDRSDFLPFKVGAAIMALGALDRDPDCNVKVVPVGLHYFHRDRFRSRAVVEFGEPIDIPPESVAAYRQGGLDKRRAIGQLMDNIQRSLKSLTVTAPDYDTLMLLQAVRRLYQPIHRKLGIEETMELTRRFAAGYERFGKDERIIALRDRVLKYNKLLRAHGLRDHQVQKTALKAGHSITLIVWRLVLLSFYAIIALPGLLINLPVVLIVRHIGEKKRREALAASTVKIKGIDVLTTWKILISFVVIPALFALYTGAFYAFVALVFELDDAVSLTILFAVALPFVSYVTTRAGETFFDIARSIKPLVLSLAGSGESLRKERAALQAEIVQVVEEYGPVLWKDFEDKRIIPAREAEISKEMGQVLAQRKVSVRGEESQWIDAFYDTDDEVLQASVPVSKKKLQ